jgi:hypothetical protein
MDDRLNRFEHGIVELRIADFLRDHWQHSHEAGKGAHFFNRLQLLEKIVEREPPFGQLGRGFLRVLTLYYLFGAVNEGEDVTHPEDPPGHAVRVEKLEILCLFTR